MGLGSEIRDREKTIPDSGSRIHDQKGNASRIRIRNTGTMMNPQYVPAVPYVFKANNLRVQERGCGGVLLLRRRSQRH
jgi:hypothetical protein